jgi:ABC-type branched-subunit amino acid transport system substrate-binding protein
MSVYGDLGLSNVITLAKEAGDAPKTAMAVGDNGASSKTFYEAAKKYFSKVGIKMLGEETWPSGTLTDATAVMQKIRNLNPDMVAFSSLAISETQMCMMKRKELGIRVPFMYSGGYGADPSFRQIGAEFLEGNICYAAFFPHKFMPQDWINAFRLSVGRSIPMSRGWGRNSVLWTMLPSWRRSWKAGSKPTGHLGTAHKLDIHDSPATKACKKASLDEKGASLEVSNLIVVQWQGGVL